MHLLVNILPEEREDGLWLTVFCGTSSSDTVGPVVPGTYMSVQLEEPVVVHTKGVHASLRRMAKRAEHQVAADIGGRVQPGSGSSVLAKGDIRKKGVTRVENKITTTGGYRITLGLLQKIRSECGPKEVPSFCIGFADKQGREQDKWVLIPYEVWRDHFANK